MSDSSANSDGAAAEDETPRGAPEPAELDDREESEDEEEDEVVEDLPPEAREDEEYYSDKYNEARDIENPDQHRDDEAYD